MDHDSPAVTIVVHEQEENLGHVVTQLFPGNPRRDLAEFLLKNKDSQKDYWNMDILFDYLELIVKCIGRCD